MESNEHTCVLPDLWYTIHINEDMHIRTDLVATAFMLDRWFEEIAERFKDNPESPEVDRQFTARVRQWLDQQAAEAGLTYKFTETQTYYVVSQMQHAMVALKKKLAAPPSWFPSTESKPFLPPIAPPNSSGRFDTKSPPIDSYEQWKNDSHSTGENLPTS